MKRQIITSRYLYLVTLLFLAALSGCASTAGYKTPISNFQNASSVVTESARVYILQLNKTQRDAYIDRQVSMGWEIKLKMMDSLQVMSPKSIAARLGALNQLSKYGSLLGQLANSDAPEKISSNAGDLAESLKTLNGNINELSAKDDKQFQSVFAPASVVIGEVARYAKEKMIQEALVEAINKGEEPVKNLIGVIKGDLEIAYSLSQSAFSVKRKYYVAAYELERKKAYDFDRLRTRGEEVKSALDAWETLPASNPTEGFDALATAHSALVDYANSPKQAENLATFSAQMEDFVARATRVGNAVKQLQQLNKN
ncbi:MAG: hypothetical protein HGB23_11280 [Chlorobiaceae bacterium]|nr:hypothetical protein [Chlorobiaceae bacterium]